MQTISDIQAGGERPFFAISDTKLSDVTILAGESAFKHGKNLSAEHCRFEGKSQPGEKLLRSFLTG